ncbi:MAG: YgfZ/GcvT domain-containing protein [Acidimicrobiales bacterium]
MTEPADRDPDTYYDLRHGFAWRAIRRDALMVAGADARSWLQGQVSNDLDPLEAGGSAWALLLSPQGKVDSFVRVSLLDGAEYLIDAPEGAGPALMDRLRRFKIRVKADLRLVEDLVAVEVRGPAAAAVALSSAIHTAAVDWPGYGGLDLLCRAGPDEVTSSAARSFGTMAGCAEDFSAARIESGWPSLGAEITDRTIPQELGEQFLSVSVSFTKGCYTGQELVARLDARGSKVARRLRGVVIESGPGAHVAPVAGDKLVVDGAEAGELTSVAYSRGLGAYVALAYVKRAVTLPGEGTAGPGSSPAVVRQLPLAE